MDTPGPVGDHIWRAVQELETGRDLPGVLWSHDATGSVGLIEAVQQVFLRMGVGVEPADGMLQVKREELVAEIAGIISFSFRLFGNIFAGSVPLFVIGSLVQVHVQWGVLLLEVMVGLIQA